MKTVEVVEEQCGIIATQNDIILSLFNELAQYISIEEQEELRIRYEIDRREGHG